MAAANTDLFIEVGQPGTATTLSSPGYTSGVSTSITVASTTNWPTATGIVFAIDEATLVDGVEVRVDGTYNEFVGTVDSATSIANVDYVAGDPERSYSAGALTRVYIPVSATRENRLAQGMVVAHNQDGTHKSGATYAVPVIADFSSANHDHGDADDGGAIVAAAIPAGSITNARLATSAGEIGAAWASWTPTLTGVTEGNGTKNASYIQIGKTVFYRLSFIFGSSSEVTTDVTMTLPVTSVAVAATGANIIGQGELYDASSGPLMALCRVKHTSTTVGTLKSWRVDGTFLTEAAVNATNPFDWTTGDAINLEGFYEAA